MKQQQQQQPADINIIPLGQAGFAPTRPDFGPCIETDGPTLVGSTFETNELLESRYGQLNPGQAMPGTCPHRLKGCSNHNDDRGPAEVGESRRYSRDRETERAHEDDEGQKKK